MVMMSGKNPGKLGIYGFRHRKPGSYSDGYIVNSTHVREEAVWDVLARNGKKSIVLGIPPGYPPKPPQRRQRPSPASSPPASSAPSPIPRG